MSIGYLGLNTCVLNQCYDVLGISTPCSADCNNCSQGNCMSCPEGYYPHDKNCLLCNSLNCSRCETNGECTSCKQGHWGLSCAYPCGIGCINGICDFNSGKCDCIQEFYSLYCTQNCSEYCEDICDNIDGSCQCLTGYYGPTCKTKCWSTCAECTNSTLCSVCLAGKYGPTCDQQCKTSCSAGSCDIHTGECKSTRRCPVTCQDCVDADNCTSCFSDNYGITCERKCPQNCNATCYQYTGYCTNCLTGRYGHMCEHNCSSSCKNSCEQLTGRCFECRNGYYESQCQHVCPANCLNNSCLRGTGDCLNCTTGFKGEKCQYEDTYCPGNCLNCLNSTYCTTCKDHYYGPYCGHSCNVYCSGNICDISTGRCIGCINETYYGANCNMSCNSNCLDNVCDRDTGVCSNGCVPDYFGNMCQNECPTYCASNGTGTKCSRDGTCTYGCVQNYYRPMCDLTCSTNCAPVVNGSRCSSDGVCTNGCFGDYNGPTCDRVCPTNCAPVSIGSKCSNDSMCVNGCSPNFYGPTCVAECPTNCAPVSGGNKCSTNGSCINGCRLGYVGTQCDVACPPTCAVVTTVSKCSDNGTCYGGCLYGYTGDKCEITIPHVGNTETTRTSLENKDAPPVPIIAGSVGGAVLLILIGVIIIILIIRKRRGKDEPDEPANSEVDQIVSTNEYHTIGTLSERSTEITIKTVPSSARVIANPNYDRLQDVLSLRRSGDSVQFESDTDVDVLEIDEDDRRTLAKQQERPHSPAPQEENVYYIGLQDIQKRKIAVDALAEFVASKPFEYFEEEYDKFPFGLTRPHNEARKPDNVAKNRYQGIYAYDDTRVKVKGGKSDYINANFIDGYLKRNAYIASLGPMKKQMGDLGIFWKMIWQHKVERVVMVTNLDEEGKSKCEKYWPDTGETNVYGDVLVKGLTEDVYAEYTRRTFKMTNGSNTRTLHHLHFTAWPDKGIPEDVTALIEFRQRVLRVPAKLGGPTLVHCSAGIGRTGTYIALDVLIHEGEAEGAVEIHGCVLNMRRNRVNMVQTAEQYEFLHRALVHALTFDCSPVAADQFQNYVAKTGQQQRQHQFNQLLSIAQHVIPKEQANIARNKSLKNKNRPRADIPGDENRPRLHVRPGTSDYVNAVYIDSFKTKRHYITAQSPLPGTVVDFLSLIYQEDCPCIVSFEHTGERKDVGVYYPADNQVLAVGDFTVSSFKMDEQVDNCVLRCIVIEYNKNGGKKRKVTHISYTDWEEDNDVPNSPASFIQLINSVEKMAVTGTHTGPILLHCLDGASKGGLYSVVSTLLQKMEIDHEVSVVNAVRKVKARRRGAIPTQEQFDFCHECVLQFIRSFDIYSNFALK